MHILIRTVILFSLLLSGCSSVGEAGFATPTGTLRPVTPAPPLNIAPPATETPLSTAPTTASPSVTSQPSASPTQSVVPANATPTAMLLPTRVFDLPKPADNDAKSTPAPSLLDQYLPGNKLLAETEHFRVYSKDGYFPVDQEWWLEQMEIVYDYVSQRLDGAEVENQIAFAFIKPDERACPVRGLASYDRTPQILIFADEEMSRDYLLAVLAHEIGHAIPSDGFPGGLPDELALTEGLATWASGKYWDRWKQVSSIHELVQGYVEAGEYEPITENYDLHGIYPWQEGTDASCIERRDKVYSAWGSFLGYLIETQGWEKAHRLFENASEERDGKRIEFPPDYEGIYGKPLNYLEAEWLKWLAAGQNQQLG